MIFFASFSPTTFSLVSSFYEFQIKRTCFYIFFLYIFSFVFSAAGITEEEKEIILREHNRLRQTVATGRYPGQPAAENMREIVWDDELADRAQKWAENCQFRHDPFRTISKCGVK